MGGAGRACRFEPCPPLDSTPLFVIINTSSLQSCACRILLRSKNVVSGIRTHARMCAGELKSPSLTTRTSQHKHHNASTSHAGCFSYVLEFYASVLSKVSLNPPLVSLVQSGYACCRSSFRISSMTRSACRHSTIVPAMGMTSPVSICASPKRIWHHVPANVVVVSASSSIFRRNSSSWWYSGSLRACAHYTRTLTLRCLHAHWHKNGVPSQACGQRRRKTSCLAAATPPRC